MQCNNLSVSRPLLLFMLLFVLFSGSCSGPREEVQQEEVISDYGKDLPSILKKGKLTVLAENSTTSFFIYRGRKMGFEYEVLREFADELGVDLDIKIVGNLDNIMEMLENGEGDIIACNYTITRERKKEIAFSVPVFTTNQVLIQRKPDGWEKMSENELEQHLITDPAQLAGKRIDVWRHSSYYDRLMNLQEEIGDSIYIHSVDGQIGSEELIEMVSEGLIDYTVVEKNVAEINERFYDNIDINTDLSYTQKIAFGLRKSSPLLNARLNDWLTAFQSQTIYKYIKHKYFDLAQVTIRSQDEFSSLKGGVISHFDKYFQEAAAKYGWDWLLLASLSYQESKFNPDIVGFGGSYGMMQFMPEVGPKYGVYPDSPPEIQILGGMKKLSRDYKNWPNIPDEVQRRKFAIASYNAGQGHVFDAQRLAEKHGLNPLVWDDNVEKMMLNLSKQEYYRDEVVRNGAMRGSITYKYVRSVYKRYEEWKAAYR